MTPRAASLKDVTANVIKKLSDKRKGKEERVRKAWRSAAGKKAEGHTEPRSLRRGRLVINVDSSALLYELTLNKRTILNKLKKRLKNDIKELNLRIGNIENQ